MVERAARIQDRPSAPPKATEPKVTSSTFGVLERSKDRSSVSRLSGSGNNVRVNISRSNNQIRGRGRIYIVGRLCATAS